MPVVTDFSSLHAGLEKTQALEVFVGYCGKQNTLFAPERWFKPYREKLLAALSPTINEDQVLALHDALLEVVKLNMVLDWLAQGGGIGWNDYKDQRAKALATELETARQAAILRGFFPWEDVDACWAKAEPGLRSALSHAPAYYGVTAHKPVEELRDQAHPCPVCGAPFDELARVYFVSPDWTWKELCGRAGWLTICDKCHIQVQFFCEVMN